MVDKMIEAYWPALASAIMPSAMAVDQRPLPTDRTRYQSPDLRYPRARRGEDRGAAQVQPAYRAHAGPSAVSSRPAHRGETRDRCWAARRPPCGPAIDGCWCAPRPTMPRHWWSRRRTCCKSGRLARRSTTWRIILRNCWSNGASAAHA